MSDSMEIIEKDSKMQDNISQIIDKNNNESYATKSKIRQNALIQSSVFKEAVNIMGETINDMDIEIEGKDDKIIFSENKIGVADDQVVDEMYKLNLNKISKKDKNDRIMNRFKKTLSSHKYITNQ